jgi:hypothetical protein
MFRWVSIAPFATPVVPPVYCRKAMSSGCSIDRLKARRHASLERVAKGHGAVDLPGRHHLLHVLDDEVDQPALRDRQQIADLRGDHMLDRRAAQHLLQSTGEVLDDDDGPAPESFNWCSSSRGVYSGLTFTTSCRRAECRTAPPGIAADWAT